MLFHGLTKRSNGSTPVCLDIGDSRVSFCLNLLSDFFVFENASCLQYLCMAAESNKNL